MTKQTQERGREGEIDYFYGQPIGSRRLRIEKLEGLKCVYAGPFSFGY